MRFHLEMEIQRNLDAGLPPGEARAAALRQFGGFDQVREQSRDQWSFVGLELWWNDLRFARDSLLRSPGFSLVTLLALALAIGLGATIFSVVDPILFRPLPLPEPQRMVELYEMLTPASPGGAGLRTNVAYADFRHWRERNRVFADVAVFKGQSFTCATAAQPEVIEGAQFSASLVSLLGVRPVLGRDFSDRDERNDAPAVVLLGYDLWQHRFGADPAILGQSIVVNDRPHTVVGVMPAGFGFPRVAEIWTPLVVPLPESTHGQHRFQCVARLRPGVTLEQARSDLATMGEAIAREHPQTNARVAARLNGLDQSMLGQFRAPSWALLGAVGLVILVACVNVASLLLGRGLSRQREFAVRAAVGASRWRATRQLFLECVLLSVAAGALGYLLSFGGLKALIALITGEIPGLHEFMMGPRSDIPYFLRFTIGWRVLGFATGMALVTCLLSGLVPAWQIMRSDAHPGLKEAGFGSVSGRRQRRWRGFLIASETAGALALLSGTGLLVRTIGNLERVDPGFAARPVVGFHILSLPTSRYGTGAQQARFYDAVRERLGTLPGVESVAVSTTVPLEPLPWTQSSNRFVVEGRAAPPVGAAPLAKLATVSPGFFGTLRIPLVRGRDFTAADGAEAVPVVIVDTTFALQAFGRENPLGQRIRIDTDREPQAWREIVGVVATAKWSAVTEGPAQPGFFLPLAQMPRPRMSVLLRAAEGDATDLMPQVRGALREIDGAVAPYRPFSLQESVSRSFVLNRVFGLVLTVFSCFAVLLATAGIVGVVAFTVAQRTHEIGVRLALGATTAAVLRLIVAQSMRPVAVGLVAGLGASVALSRLWEGQLYGVGRNDPATLATSAAMLGSVALVACYFPARGATRVDPQTVLRAE